MAVITLLMVVVVIGVTLASCYCDVTSLRIPNIHALLVIACFVPAYFAAPAAFGPWWSPLGGLGVMFVLTYIMFLKGMIGGGDSKLGAALGLWVGLRGLMPFVFYMAIMGGVLSFIALLLHKKKFFNNPKAGSWIAEAQSQGNAIPYGIAISFGSWMAFFHTGLLHQELNELFKIIH